MRQDTESFISGVVLELERARRKFPEQDQFVTLAALTEEVGELAQAVLHLKFEPKKGKTYADVRAEAQQVAVMAIRVALDCHLAPEIRRRHRALLIAPSPESTSGVREEKR